METINSEEIKENVENNVYNHVTMSSMNITITDIFEVAKTLKIENITGIKFLPSKTEYVAEVKTNNKLFYMGISTFGFVEAVREDSMDGNIIYVPNDDHANNVDSKNIESNDNLEFSTRQDAIDAYMKRFGKANY